MRLLFEFSGEHPSIPKSELRAVFGAEVFQFNILREEKRLVILDFEGKKKDALRIGKRLALTRSIDEHLFSCAPNDAVKMAKQVSIPKGTFRVRVKKYDPIALNSLELERKVGNTIKKSGRNRVDLERPKTELRLLLGNQCHFAVKVQSVNRSVYENRKGDKRPFSSPISMHPRLARALVNLSRARKGKSLLDPFCGTGGILIEARLIGCKPIGADISQRMVEGTRRNLKYYGLSARLFTCDIGQINEVMKEKVRYIATDPPYGRSASTRGERIENLYNRAFDSFTKVLKEDGYLAIVLPNTDAVELGKEYLSLQEFHALRVHKSLTRYFCVYRK